VPVTRCGDVSEEREKKTREFEIGDGQRGNVAWNGRGGKSLGYIAGQNGVSQAEKQRVYSTSTVAPRTRRTIWLKFEAKRKQWERGRASGGEREGEIEGLRTVSVLHTSIDQPIETRPSSNKCIRFGVAIYRSMSVYIHCTVTVWRSLIFGPIRQEHGQSAVMKVLYM